MYFHVQLYHKDHTPMKLHKTLMLLLIIPCMICGCAHNTSGSLIPVSRTGLYFDTVVSVTLYEYEGSSDRIFDECIKMCERYESLFSATVPDSDIWRINNAGGSAVTVDPETAKLISDALEYSRSSGGLIDPTIGGVCELWDISSQVASGSYHIPDDESISEALSHVDHEKITVSGNTVTVSDPDAHLTLGFIAKGYVADRIAEYLAEAGVASALIDLGGNIKAVGNKPDGLDFHIGIQKPFADKGEPITTVSVRDASVVSSGVYERYFTLNDHIYHHIFDTEKGYPVDGNVIGVTVISSSSEEADVLSTLCLITGVEKGLDLIEDTEGVEAMFITSDYALHASSGWPDIRQ